MKVLVAVLTTGSRSTTFEQCLLSIIDQKIGSDIETNILIVENNLEYNESVKASLSKFSNNKNINIIHVLETQKGIPYARNHALAYATSNNYDYLAFIDDDAYAKENWIQSLYSKANGFDVIAGPQKAIFPINTSKYFTLASLYHERKVNDGCVIKWAATNNILINVNTLKKCNLKFNDALVHGGEDKELFLRLTACGGKIIWTKDAIVQEHIVRERLTTKWALRRCFRMGATGFKIESCNKPFLKVLLTCSFKGGAYLTKGLVSFLPFFLSSKHTCLDSLCDLSHGVGFFYGILSGGEVRSYA
ncbi:glycosyltransferase family A protein [Pseudoalteromonas agarivorans]|uniref:glycosyltransferase family 2 protein n=1 Tax=Pseudoalteromonas agarivorans TaxID=176102 RepID=UPI00311FABD1